MLSFGAHPTHSCACTFKCENSNSDNSEGGFDKNAKWWSRSMSLPAVCVVIVPPSVLRFNQGECERMLIERAPKKRPVQTLCDAQDSGVDRGRNN